MRKNLEKIRKKGLTLEFSCCIICKLLREKRKTTDDPNQARKNEFKKIQKSA